MTFQKGNKIGINRIPWNKGISIHSEKIKEQIGKAHKGKNNHYWKGNKASYSALHKWVNRWKGKPKICIDCSITCKERTIWWSNINHKYRRILSDYEARCVPCHRKYDKENNQL